VWRNWLNLLHRNNHESIWTLSPGVKTKSFINPATDADNWLLQPFYTLTNTPQKTTETLLAFYIRCYHSKRVLKIYALFHYQLSPLKRVSFQCVGRYPPEGFANEWMRTPKGVWKFTRQILLTPFLPDGLDSEVTWLQTGRPECNHHPPPLRHKRNSFSLTILSKPVLELSQTAN